MSNNRTPEALLAAYTQEHDVPLAIEPEMRKIHDTLIAGIAIARDAKRFNDLMVARRHPDLAISVQAKMSRPGAVCDMGTQQFEAFRNGFVFSSSLELIRWKTITGAKPSVIFNDICRLQLDGGKGELQGITGPHAEKRAFHRMLGILPNFTTRLVVDSVVASYEAPVASVPDATLYAAYSMMSELVDVGDSGVTSADGSVDANYLQR